MGSMIEQSVITCGGKNFFPKHVEEKTRRSIEISLDGDVYYFDSEL